MIYLGDFPASATPYFKWNTTGQDGASITRATNGTLKIYRNNSTDSTQVGLTQVEDFDGLTGIHHITIDTTATAYYAAGSEYMVVMAGMTIDTKVVNSAIAHFSIERLGGIIDRLRRHIVRGAVTTGASTTSIPTSSLSPAAAVNDQFKGRIVIFDRDTTTTNLRGQATDITGSTSGGTLTVTALTTAPANGDFFTIY